MTEEHSITILKPDDISENMAEQAAARLAHKHNRTIIVQINTGSQQRNLVIPPDHPITEEPSDWELVLTLLKESRAVRKRISLWKESLEEKINSEN